MQNSDCFSDTYQILLKKSKKYPYRCLILLKKLFVQFLHVVLRRIRAENFGNIDNFREITRS